MAAKRVRAGSFIFQQQEGGKELVRRVVGTPDTVRIPPTPAALADAKDKLKWVLGEAVLSV